MCVMFLLLIVGAAADLGLSMFVWEAVCHGSVNVANRRCFLAIFDMNRWYNAQMPSCIRYALFVIIDRIAGEIILLVASMCVCLLFDL